MSRKETGIQVLETSDNDELLEADLRFWLRADASVRLLAVDEARRDCERMGKQVTGRDQPGVNTDFEDFLSFLNQAGADYLIIGGYAVAFHSTPRYTKDLDVLVRPDPENGVKVLKAIEWFIGDPGIDPERFSKPGLVLMFGIPPTRIDVLTSIAGCDFDQAFSQRVEGTYGSQKAWFIGLDDLIQAKLAAGRQQDLMDVKRLERVRRMT